MSDIDYFKFEKKDLDFPIYKNNPYVPKSGWVVLFIAIFIGMLMQGLTGSELIDGILFVAIVLIPLLYYLKWDYKAIFQKPSLRDIGLAVALFIGYIIYSIILSTALEPFGIVSSGLIEKESVTVITVISSIFSLMGEEFLKFLPFMFFLRLSYKFSNKRKLSVAISVGLVMIMFASLHAYNPIMFVYALFIQGLGSIFEFYGYIKTKNIMVSYITHLCTDLFIFSFVLFGLI